MIICFNSVLTQAMLLMMMISNSKMIIIDQIPPLTNMIFHHPGTFDSCLEVDFQLPPYQQTQVITMMMTMMMLTRQSLKSSLASIASSPPTIATLSILKAHTKGDHFTPVSNLHQFNMYNIHVKLYILKTGTAKCPRGYKRSSTETSGKC